MAKSNTRITADKDEVAIYTYEYTATSGQTTFSGSDDNSATLDYTAGSITVSYGGLELPESDYTATNGTSVVLADGAVAGEIIRVVAYEPFVVSDALPITGGTLTGGLNVSSGNVGIGTSSPSGKLDVELGADGVIAEFRGADTDLLQIKGASNTIALDARNIAALTFEIQGSERMRIDSSGIVTTPNQPAFCVYNPNGLHYLNSATSAFGKNYTGGTFGTHVNAGGHFSTSTGRFTAPVAGNYYFSCNFMVDGANSNSGFDIKKNGASINGGEGLDSGNSNYCQISGSVLITLSVGDYIECQTRGNGSVHQRYGSFEGYLIG